jgi:tRNA(Glu) U13 pseudouridine synthase TruD
MFESLGSELQATRQGAADRLGELQANKFIITVYGVNETHKVHIPNYFGDQRFSTENVEVGLMLLRGKFLEVAKRLKDQYPEIRKHLSENETDGIGSLRKAPQLSLIMYVHSVQSWLFNQAVSGYVKEEYDEYVTASYRHGELAFPVKELPDMQVPLVGAAQPLGKWEKYYAPLLREHKLSPSAFYIRSLPYLTQEGTMRSLASEIHNLKVQKKDSTATVSVTLGSGCYATVVLAGLIS